MDDLLNEFLTETAESIDEVDVQLVELEQDPNNKAVLANIFRLVHTIKGTCGFLGLPRLEKVAHAAENVLGQFRDGVLSVTPDAVTVILASLDRIKEILAGLEETEEEPHGDDSELVARLDAIITGGGSANAESKSDQLSDAASDPEIDALLGASDQTVSNVHQIDQDKSAGSFQQLERDLRPGEVTLDELEAAFAAAPGPDDADDGMPAAAVAATSSSSLYDKCGGDDALTVASHMMATRLENNPQMGRLFAAGLKEKLLGLFKAVLQDDEKVAESLGGACIAKSGFGQNEFEKFVEMFTDILKEVGVDGEACGDAQMMMEMLREPMTEKSQSFVQAEKAAAAKAESAGDAANDDDSGASKKSGDGGRVQSIRVSVDLLEDLMNMVSELVLTRNQLMQMVRQTDDSEFSVPLQRLSQCTTELQESVMKTRMQPIGNAWAKLPRIIRDLALELDKQIELEMIGAETELDRQVLDLIKDPLTHMVRNSADHGIEQPAERLAMGKKEKGTIKLNAYHEGGHIIIEIADDGRGIAVDKLRKKIIEKGLASEAEAMAMSTSQVQKFIFHAGFSTAEKVTNVSGRGVGMDVVRTNIEKIGGTIEMNSVEGKGTTMSIKIPLTLAIVSGMIVKAAGQRFAIPQISVLELVRCSEASEYRVERIKDTPVLRLRNRLLPLVYLNHILGFMTQEEVDEQSKTKDQFIVVTQVGAFTFGIVVDQVYDTEEIVVKPVAPILKALSIYSGNTILGDGTVIMILDPNGIAAKTNSNFASNETELMQAELASANNGDTETILVFRAGSKAPKAVPLALVARLEDIEVERIEESDRRLLVQYRGSLMPLVMFDENCKISSEERQSVIVFSDGDRTMGLAVDEILDIVEERLEIELSSNTEGVVGSAIVEGKATEMIDVSHFMGKAFPDSALSLEDQHSLAPESGTSVLLVDDSSFFRNMLKPLLVAAGYGVKTASNAEEALKLREEGKSYDLIISDIEMPGMDGFELAETIKRDGHWKETPLVALSNLASEKDFDRGRQAGFNDYVAKFDRDALLVSLSQQLKLKENAA